MPSSSIDDGSGDPYVSPFGITSDIIEGLITEIVTGLQESNKNQLDYICGDDEAVTINSKGLHYTKDTIIQSAHINIGLFENRL
jgi:hypothetical protein